MPKGTDYGWTITHTTLTGVFCTVHARCLLLVLGTYTPGNTVSSSTFTVHTSVPSCMQISGPQAPSLRPSNYPKPSISFQA